jgi:hypothetical protein
MPPDNDPADLHVSCVDGLPVTRYGSRVLIGADRTLDGVTYRPEQIVKIPAAEAARYRREYARQIADGALVVRRAEEWEAQSAAHSKAEADAEAQKAERKRAREEEARRAHAENPQPVLRVGPFIAKPE